MTLMKFSRALAWISVSLMPLTVEASRICSSGPDCDQIRTTVALIKTLKSQRHEDVVKYGRRSAAVRADDQRIQEATALDRKQRSERREKTAKESRPKTKKRTCI
jgi:hypothetical protein